MDGEISKFRTMAVYRTLFLLTLVCLLFVEGMLIISYFSFKAGGGIVNALIPLGTVSAGAVFAVG
ncbi:MAG: hypothetical protein HYU64_18160 [Armatimonadetes bacterium]|nr:hypothetical protein [Armatimonadota bacterium]